MRLIFYGAARTVTGSKHLLVANRRRILLECGLFQGRRKDTYEKNLNFDFNPGALDFVLLSHAHIDHSGNLPNLVKRGYQGPIVATGATVDLCQIMLRDSAHLQEKDVEFVNKIRRRKHQPPVKPLYTMEDAERALNHLVGVQYDHPFQLAPGIVVTYRDAGHILGSAGLVLEIRERGQVYRLGFSGDIGRRNMPILRDPNVLRDLDYLIMECTYGNRLHRLSEDVEEELAETVRRVAHRGGKIMIPAFAVGRTQTLVYLLHKLFNQNRIPNLPIYVDSPLATGATEIFRAHPECFDRETYRLFLRDDIDPFGFGRLKYIREVEDSKALNYLKFPAIIISASGMAEGGRILHHLRNNVGDPRNLVLLVGYAAPHTLARKLRDGQKQVRIFGEPSTVRCEVKVLEDFSGHADQAELLDYVRQQNPRRLKAIFLVHGEEDQAIPFQKKLKEMGFRQVFYPRPGESFRLP